MSNNDQLDDELAAYTDYLLTGRTMPISGELEPLSHVVRQIHTVIAPDSPPSPAFRTHLTQRLIREWNLVYQRQPRLVWVYRLRPLMILAASLLLGMLAIVLLSLRDGNHNESLEGTALGPLGWGIFIAAGTLIGAGLIALWLRRRSRP